MEDHVDGVVATWRTSHPDWDFTGMALFGRVSRIERLLEVRRLDVLRPDGLATADIDVLASLWRNPDGQRPRDLRRTMMVGSGTLTPRLDRLEAAGWIQRSPDPDDLRGRVLTLTDDGRRQVPQLVERLLRVENDALAELPRTAVDRLVGDLRRLLTSLDD
ncbi:MAG TPA: MarR family transcriptional regulator [Ilumatobacteraceae bacterium]|nr:MarR family transcriptional regulator [Ilumatobacteraceae bacterium]